MLEDQSKELKEVLSDVLNIKMKLGHMQSHMTGLLMSVNDLIFDVMNMSSVVKTTNGSEPVEESADKFIARIVEGDYKIRKKYESNEQKFNTLTEFGKSLLGSMDRVKKEEEASDLKKES